MRCYGHALPGMQESATQAVADVVFAGPQEADAVVIATGGPRRRYTATGDSTPAPADGTPNSGRVAVTARLCRCRRRGHPVSPGGSRSRLPVEATIEELRSALLLTASAVLQAPPGAGKTTIVPLRLLAEPWLDDRRIVMLEPRRLAARAAARRMADLLGEEVGGTVGYRTRDERHVGRDTRIEVVTEGILTRRLQRDPSLTGTGLVIFDEIHERNLQTDLALAFTLDARDCATPRPAHPGDVGHPRHRSSGAGDRPRPDRRR